MAQTTLNVRIDENVKKQFDIFCSELGMNASVAVNLFVKTVIRERRIPFELSLDVPNQETIEAIKEVEKMKNNPNKKVYNNFSELLNEVKSDV